MQRGFHPKSDVDKHYAERVKGGRGLRSVETVVNSEKMSLQSYTRRSDEKITEQCKIF